VAEPSQDEIDAAKAAFLGYLGAEVEKITVADVEIEEEDITVTFNRDAKVAEVYQAANELVEALKGELEEAKLTLNGEREFDLSDEGVAVQIALYLLDGTDPEEFLKGKEAVEASYTVEATDQDGITFTLAGDLVFKVAEPSQDEIDAAKAAFLGYLGAEVEKITVADVEIEEEDITVTFNRDAKVAEVYQAANELVEALKGELEEAKLTLNGEREFDLSDEGVAVQIALYLLDGTDPEEFLKGKEAVEAIYTVEATDQDGITFTLAGDLVFKVAEPSQDEIDAAKAAFLGYLGAEVEKITVADVEIEEEDITVTFNRDAKVAEVYQAANELVEALKGELEEAKLTLNGEREFDLSDEGVAVQIALYLLDGTDPEEFLKGKEAVEASYTVEATDQDGITFTLAGDLVFKVAEPSQDEIDAAKAAFLGYLGAEVEKITVADVEIEEEDITVTFNRDAKVAEVYQAANELVEALKGELEEAKLTLNGEREFDLSDEGVAVQIALYLLDGTDPEEFLKGKEAVEASYTVEATDQDGITFTLAGDLVFKVAEPSQDEIDAAKAAFLGYLGAEVEKITVADVEIEEEDITVTFNRDAKVAEVYQAANELVEALKGELEEAKLTLNGEREFDLSDEGVAVQIALYLLDGTDPEEFLKGKEAVEASYTVEATDQDGITFTLAGDLVFKVAEPSQDEIDAAKAAFLGYLGAEVEKITVADVEIEEEDITVTFNRDAKVAEVYQAANELVEALKGELEAAKLTLNDEREFDLTDENVAVQIALYLLDGTDPEEFLKGKEAVEASYTVEATDQDGITFTLAGDLVFKVAEPSQDEIDAAKAAFLGYLEVPK
jgi:uncharacterized protein YaiL (DUF2058 family)